MINACISADGRVFFGFSPTRIYQEVDFNILSSGMQKSLEFALWGLQSKKQRHPFFHINSPSVDLVFEQAIRTIVLAYY